MARGRNKKRRENRKRRAEQQKAQPQVAPPPSPAVEVQKEEPQIHATKSGNDAIPKQQDWVQPKPKRKGIKLQDWFAFALVLFTFGQGIVGYMQWDATNKQYNAMLEQNKIARDGLANTAKSVAQMEWQLDLMAGDQRPWLEISEPVLTGMEPRKDIVISVGAHFRITNSGKTAAHVKSASIGIFTIESGKFSPEQEERILDEATLHEVKSIADEVIPPGGSTEIWGHDKGTDILRLVYNQWKDIDSGHLQVFVRGVVLYRDIGGNPGKTEWCYRWAPFRKELDRWHSHNAMR